MLILQESSLFDVGNVKTHAFSNEGEIKESFVVFIQFSVFLGSYSSEGFDNCDVEQCLLHLDLCAKVADPRAILQDLCFVANLKFLGY